jgi:hypothetical protein
MSLTKLNVRVALAAALWACAAGAHAEDFNITVPVSFSRLAPEIEVLEISCTTMSRDQVIGHGRAAPIRLSGGGYSGNVVVRFNATTGMDPRAATHYRCQPSLRALKGTPFYVPGPASPVPNVVVFPVDPKASIRWNTGDLPLPR